MATKLFIGSIPYSATDAELADHFAQAGNVVSATILMDKFTGRSRGFGFVEMSSEDEAQAAIDQLNGKDFMGRELVVNEARPQQPRENRGGFDRQ